MQFTPDHPRWPHYVAHLKQVGMAQWVLDDENRPLVGVYFLGITGADSVIGHISLKMQNIIIPATEWGGGHEIPVTGSDNYPLREMFVQTFAVEEAYRRQGYGRALQLEALKLTEKLGCYQMRSWSSLDKNANYALKLDWGFAIQPAIYETDSRLRVSGVYFVRSIG